MNSETKRLVRERADGRCEYCRLPQAAQPFVTFPIEHVIPRKHGGTDDASNVALACERCNSFKGPNLTGLDRLTGRAERLFDPCSQIWDEHFAFDGAWIRGKTSVGRVTVEVMCMNETRRARLRAELIALGEF